MKAIDLKTIFLAGVFVYFLSPITIGLGFSANYFFLLFPIAFVISQSKIYFLPDDIRTIFIIYCLIFFAAALIQYSYWELLPRKLTSFLLFITIFSFAIIDLSQRMINAFKLAVIAYVTYLSLSSILELREIGIAGLGYQAKYEVGTQRYGFFYILSFWLIFFYQTNQPIFRLIKIPLLAITVIGLMLTFSRASVVGLIGSALMFLMIMLITQFKFTKKSIGTFFVYGTAVILLLGFTGLYEYLSIPIEYFTNRLFSSRWEDGTSNWDVLNPNSSEGYRIYLIMRILEYVANSPIYGSGFLGIWVILEDQIGSAHGQYNDMLFRTGFFGLLIYLFFLYKLGLYLYKNDMGLFLGYVGILVFGLFHETFKLSQGAFLFAFLVGMWAQSLRKDNNENRY